MEWSGGGKWDNCNSIINKYIKKKNKKKKRKEKNKVNKLPCTGKKKNTML